MTAPADTPISTTCDVTVPWVPFRRALCAVLPCASREAESAGTCRVRIDVRADGRVLVTASDRFVAGLVVVDALVPARQPAVVDLHPDEARKALAVFPEMKDEAGELMLRLLVSQEQLEIRDVSGMVDGEDADEATLAALAADPRIAEALAGDE